MPKTGCRLCRKVRLVLACVVLGGGLGLLVDALGASSNLSMTATFLGAVAPLMWHARRERRAAPHDD